MTIRDTTKQKMVRIPHQTARRVEVKLAKTGQKFSPVMSALVEMWLEGKITLDKQNHAR